MRRRGDDRRGPTGTLALLGALLAALLVLAFLQYRWIAQLGDAEKARAHSRLEEASRAFCDDLDRELERALALCNAPLAQPGDEARFVSARLNRWKESALFPQLVSDVFLAREDGEGRVALFRIDPLKGEAIPCDWPASLEPLRRRLPAHPGPLLQPDLPAIVVPLGAQPPDSREGGPGGGPGLDFAVVLLDLDWITKTFLPERARAHFGGDRALAYRVTILGSAPGRRVLFSDGPDAPPSDPSTGDVTRMLFLQRSFPARPGPGSAENPDGPPRRAPANCRKTGPDGGPR